MRKLILVLCLLGLASTARAQTPPYSTPPILQAFQATGLSMPYTAGIVTVGGTQQIIQVGAVVLANNMNNCQAPGYVACNLVYWGGQGTALSVTQNPATAFQSGTAIVGFVTTVGNAIINVVYFSQAAQASDNLLPAGVMAVAPNNGLRIGLCNLVRTLGCQLASGSLSGY